MRPAWRSPTCCAGLDQAIVDVRGLLGRDVQLVAQLAEVRDANAQRARIADVDLLRGAERKCLVREIVRRDRLHQLARARSLDVDLRVAGGDVGDERVRAAVGLDVTAHPGLDVTMRGVGRDDPELLVAELRDGEVGLELSGAVEPLRVRDHAGGAVHVVGRDEVQDAAGVASLDEELRHEGHVHEDDALPRRLVLGLPVREPFLASPRERVDLGLDAVRRIPVGALPAAHVAEVGALAWRADRRSRTSSRRARSSSSASDNGIDRPFPTTRRFAYVDIRDSPDTYGDDRCSSR